VTVPLYSYEQEFQGYIPERYALKLERNGVAKLRALGPIEFSIAGA
jgi:hypothetical protein